MSSLAWNDEFKELTAEFVRSAGGRLHEVGSTLDALERAPDNRVALDDLRRHFHRLVGAGATYGFAAVSDLSRRGEQLCDTLIAGERRMGSEDLATCRHLLGALSTAFEARSEDLTPVWLTPPVAAEPSAAASDPLGATPTVAASLSRAQSRPYDILVVDDDPLVSATLVGVLRSQDICIRVVKTCAGAFDELQRAQPDALIVDVVLPDGLGYDVVREARRLAGPDGVDMGIIVLSKAHEFLDHAEAIQAGADACFEKPIDWEGLIQKLHHLLDRDSDVPPRVLVVEDDEHHAAFVRSVLESGGYTVEVCPAPRQFREVLAAFRPDLLLMDIGLPDVNGYDLARYVRQLDQFATLPIVFLTSESALTARIRTVRAGGDDHIVKPVHPALLVSSVAARLERARFFKTLLTRDGLTRLLTHTSFIEQAQALVAVKRRDPQVPATLVMLDIDHFKTINDTHGHQAGDRVLVSLSALLRRHLRRTDVVGRYGGEEFAILLDHLRASDAQRLMQRLLHEFSTTDQRSPDGAVYRATFSAGIAQLDPARMDTDRWIQAADATLYAAKKAGRNLVLVYTAPESAPEPTPVI